MSKMVKEVRKMKNKIFSKRLWVVVGVGLMFCASSVNAFAYDRPSGYRGGGDARRPAFNAARHDNREHVAFRGREYRYDAGRFFERGLFGIFFGIPAPVGVSIHILPFGYRTVVVRGARYYCYNNVYYQDYPNGYMVVQAPQPETFAGGTMVINVPNSNGSYTPVTLTRTTNGYIGPQGEYYPAAPTMDQLRALYGR